MQLGIHLPHAGEQATPEKIRHAAMRAEDLGLDDVWVSEHIIVPRATFPLRTIRPQQHLWPIQRSPCTADTPLGRFAS